MQRKNTRPPVCPPEMRAVFDRYRDDDTLPGGSECHETSDGEYDARDGGHGGRGTTPQEAPQRALHGGLGGAALIGVYEPGEEPPEVPRWWYVDELSVSELDGMPGKAIMPIDAILRVGRFYEDARMARTRVETMSCEAAVGDPTVQDRKARLDVVLRRLCEVYVIAVNDADEEAMSCMRDKMRGCIAEREALS